MKKNLAKKIIGLVLSFMILFGCIPMQVSIAYPGDDGQQGLTANNPGQYDIDGRPVLVYVTSNGGDVSRTSGSNSDSSQQFTATPNDNWIFHKWLTYYDGPSSNAPNPNFTWSSDWCFSQPGNADNEYISTNKTIQVNREWDAKGTYYLYAIFRPKVTIETDMSSTISFRTAAPEFVSGIGSVETYVPYGNIRDIQIYLENNRVVESVKINNESKTYQISNGWIQLNDYDVTRPTNIKVVTRKKIQNVNFDANGGSGTMATQTFNSDEEKALTANSFIMDNYKFIGWNTKSDRSGTSYIDKESIIFTPANDGDSITLYAQWEKLPIPTYTPPTPNDLTYNTTPQELVTKGDSNDGVLMYKLGENGTYDKEIPVATDAGEYTVYYYVEGDNNHSDSDEVSVTVEIKKANPDIGTVSANIINDTTDISSIVLERTDETVKGSLIVDKEQTLNLGDNEIKYSFVPDDTKNYNQINGTVNVTVKDTIAPIGTVTFTDAETVWDDIPGAITFDMYFKNNQKVVVTATDSFSGIDKIEYYETDEVLDLEGLEILDDSKWTLMGSDVDLTAEDAKQFIYYIRITDKSGNVAFIATNGAEFDTTAPMINGVYDGKTYYTSQKVTVTDKNLDTVTLNGEPAEDTIILEGNKEATYTIVATDKAGNSTTVTVKMAMLDDITDVNPDNVTPQDKPKLEDAKNELEKNLEENADIYSEEEKKAIEDKIKEIDEALDVIEKVEDVEDLINNLPENITKNDSDAVEVAKKAYENLSDYEETLVNSDFVKKLEDAIKANLELQKTSNENKNENINENKNNNLPTGDNINIYFAIFVLSILGIGVIIKKRTKEKNKNEQD